MEAGEKIIMTRQRINEYQGIREQFTLYPNKYSLTWVILPLDLMELYIKHYLELIH